MHIQRGVGVISTQRGVGVISLRTFPRKHALRIFPRAWKRKSCHLRQVVSVFVCLFVCLYVCVCAPWISRSGRFDSKQRQVFSHKSLVHREIHDAGLGNLLPKAA